MIDEKKVALMTRLSIYEKKEKNDALVMSKYFERDYVRFNVLKTLVAATLVYWSIVGAYVFLSFESILESINNMDYFGVMYRILGWYVFFCFIYFFFSYLVYSYRYNKKRKGLARYNSDLKDLIELSGGPMHHAKLVKHSNINVVKGEKKNTSKNGSASAGKSVNKTRLLNEKLKQEEEERNRQIIENSKRLEEKRAARKAMEEQKRREEEENRLRIRQKRLALEEEQRQIRRQEISDSQWKGDNR